MYSSTICFQRLRQSHPLKKLCTFLILAMSGPPIPSPSISESMTSSASSDEVRLLLKTSCPGPPPVRRHKSGHKQLVFCMLFWAKIITNFCFEGKTMTPHLEEIYLFCSFLQSNLSWSRTFEGLFELTRHPSRALQNLISLTKKSREPIHSQVSLCLVQGHPSVVKKAKIIKLSL